MLSRKRKNKKKIDDNDDDDDDDTTTIAATTTKMPTKLVKMHMKFGIWNFHLIFFYERPCFLENERKNIA